jgi:hypothetical protein
MIASRPRAELRARLASYVAKKAGSGPAGIVRIWIGGNGQETAKFFCAVTTNWHFCASGRDFPYQFLTPEQPITQRVP